jgi:hypothetical protein
LSQFFKKNWEGEERYVTKKFKRLFFPIIATLLVLLVAAPLASTPTLSTPINALIADQPGPLTLGDTWTYNQPINETHNATLTQRVVSTIASVEDWNGTMTQCYKIEIETSPSPYNESWGYQYYRVSDQKFIATEGYAFWNISGLYSEGYTFSYNNVPTETGYPLSLGKTWNQTITSNATGYSYTWNGMAWDNKTWVRSNATQFTYWQACEVLNISNVTVPAGTFETWCITISTNATLVNPPTTTGFGYFSPTVKNFVLLTNSTGDLLAELVSYSLGLDLTGMIWWLVWGQLLQQIMSPFAGRNLFILGGAAAALILISAGIFIWWKRMK